MGKFRDMVMECTNDVCGMRCVGRQQRKGSEWWNIWVEWWPKREELLKNGYRGEIGPVCQNEWRTGNGRAIGE